MKVPRKLLNALRSEQDFVVAAHVNPDGDALGSAIALSVGLRSLGKRASVYSRDPVPRPYAFLPEKEFVSSDLERLRSGDPALILVDCNSPERAGLDPAAAFRRALVIDHHKTESAFGDAVWIDSSAAATGMMIYSVLRMLRCAITPEIATNLYTAISIDTGSFRFANTSAEALNIAGALVASGADPGAIAHQLYETWTENRFRLFVRTLNTLDIEGRVAFTHVTEQMLRETGANSEDTENFSGVPRGIDTISVSALLRELPNHEWKVSLRSKGNTDVAKVAEQFGGGGHRNAAGCKLSGDLGAAKKLLLSAIRTALI